MAENLLNSKLKRRKLSSEVKNSSGASNRSHSAAFCPRKSAEPHRCVSPAAAPWWSRGQLTSVETLWAQTLQAALPHLEEQQWQQLPQLPSAVRRPPLVADDEQRWCDLSDEVTPFTDSGQALLRTSSGPNPCSSSSSSSSLVPVQSAQTRLEAAGPSDTRPPQQEKAAPHLLHEAPRCLRPDGDRGATSASPSASDCRRFTEDTCHNEAEVLTGGPVRRNVGEDGDAAAGGGGGGGGGLQSCPMCLLEFPTRWSQMERDGHLAQCLSEVNVDVTW